LTETSEPQRRSLAEFVTLMALMISLVAMSIDAMLPALPEIGADLGVREANHNQLVISALLIGLAAGQLFYGPISDSVGRKPGIYVGLALFLIGCLMCIFATSFTVMLAGRFLQGIGVAAPRTVAVALIRDQYEGRAMARVMSFIMAVFILVPALAPAMGQVLLLVAHWRMIFVCFAVLAVIALVWFALRQPETLPPQRRRRLSLTRIALAVVETCTTREAFGYIVAAGLIFGAFVGYLTSAQQIFQAQYGLGVLFPLAFAILSLGIGCASVLNARLVMRLGMRFLSGWALVVLTVLSAGYFAYAAFMAGHPPLWTLMAYGLVSFFCMGLLFGNFNALAMEPLGHIAGVAAAVVGCLTSFMSLMLGTAIGQAYDGTVLPLVGGFAVLGLAALGAMHWAGKAKT